jgi:hypothetical protein
VSGSVERGMRKAIHYLNNILVVVRDYVGTVASGATTHRLRLNLELSVSLLMRSCCAASVGGGVFKVWLSRKCRGGGGVDPILPAIYEGDSQIVPPSQMPRN